MNSPRTGMNRVVRCSCALAGVLLLGACAISPDPISDGQHLARAQAERQKLYEAVPAIDGPLTLEEAIARALRFNYDHRLALLEQTLQNSQLTLANFNMLPRLAANAGYTVRDVETASSSVSILTRRQSLEPSVSQDESRWTGDITFTWNLLDFGLSYFQAKQQADRALIAVERRRRVVNNMIREVRSAYWRAATAERLLPQIEPVINEAEKALEASREIERDGLQAPVETLEYQRTILQVVSQLRRLRSDLSVAKSQLASLVNIPPGTSFAIAAAGLERMPVPQPPTAPLAELELYGLTLRPELREEVYQERVDRQNVYREILRMVPGVSLFAGPNYDSNSYLVNNQWNEAGFRVTWNLIGLLQGPKAVEVAESQGAVTAARRLALSIAVITQINISYQQFLQAREAYRTAQAISDVEAKITSLTRGGNDAQAVPELERIRRSTSAIAAELERDRALSELQGAVSNIYVAIGMDPLPAGAQSDDYHILREQVRASLVRMESGMLPALPQPEPPASEKAAEPTMPLSTGIPMSQILPAPVT
ncbi:TolC family protein [Arenibaculum pallidiluteum]|uniref:TolC family protein n=1 Tax=Arenibaculum pallidiluteum TaxID=2812559 RepID=UPI001A967632|nr:TolC family protein [Arenibaculum pallidiluteum]